MNARANWRDTLRSIASTKIIPLSLFVLLAATPFLYRALPASGELRLNKAAIIVPFSGQLQSRGNDLYAAARLALQDAYRQGGAHTFDMFTALDDHGQPATAADQARLVAADPGVGSVLCCGTGSALAPVSSQLPVRVRLLALDPASATMASAEARLAARQFGTGRALVLSDMTTPGASRAASLVSALRAAGFDVVAVPVNFAAGSQPVRLAQVVVSAAPQLVVFDADYPATATLGAALRAAGVTVPFLGDERLDGAPAAGLVGALSPVYYLSFDRDALLRDVPAGFPAAFQQARGHAPSAGDVLAYLQVRAAFDTAHAPVGRGRLPIALSEVVPGTYPGRTVAMAAAPNAPS